MEAHRWSSNHRYSASSRIVGGCKRVGIVIAAAARAPVGPDYRARPAAVARVVQLLVAGRRSRRHGNRRSTTQARRTLRRSAAATSRRASGLTDSPRPPRPLARFEPEPARQMQIVFRRLSSRMSYNKAIWAIAHRLCRLIWKVLHDNVHYVEHSLAPSPIALKRRR